MGKGSQVKTWIPIIRLKKGFRGQVRPWFYCSLGAWRQGVVKIIYTGVKSNVEKFISALRPGLATPRPFRLSVATQLNGHHGYLSRVVDR
jgi:hypothetical protein